MSEVSSLCLPPKENAFPHMRGDDNLLKLLSLNIASATHFQQASNILNIVVFTIKKENFLINSKDYYCLTTFISSVSKPRVSLVAAIFPSSTST